VSEDENSNYIRIEVIEGRVGDFCFMFFDYYCHGRGRLLLPLLLHYTHESHVSGFLIHSHYFSIDFTAPGSVSLQRLRSIFLALKGDKTF
jgi:hypothetical protein